MRKLCARKNGTCSKEAMKNLKWQISHEEADRICCFNRKSAERKGSFQNQTQFKNEFLACDGKMDFHDSVTGKILFSAPKYRTKDSVYLTLYLNRKQSEIADHKCLNSRTSGQNQKSMDGLHLEMTK